MGDLTHLDAEGTARMVDVGAKEVTARRAVARAVVRMTPATAERVAAGDAPKGDVLGVARIAGIQAAKRTGELIPLCHPIGLDHVDVDAELDAAEGTVTLTATAARHRAHRRRDGGDDRGGRRRADRLRHGQGPRARRRDRGGGAAEKSGGRSGDWVRDAG